MRGLGPWPRRAVLLLVAACTLLGGDPPAGATPAQEDDDGGEVFEETRPCWWVLDDYTDYNTDETTHGALLTCDTATGVQPNTLQRDDWPRRPRGCEDPPEGAYPLLDCTERAELEAAEEVEEAADGADNPNSADPQWPGDPCRWEIDEAPDRTAVLDCYGIDPATVEEADWPSPLPSGCEVRDVVRNSGVPYVRCEPGDGTVDVDCRDEVDWWFDDHGDDEVPEEAPQWWLDEIERESTSDEGQGCELADHPPELTCAEREEEPTSWLIPDGCWGTYPSSHYELTWEDGEWYDVGEYNDRLSGWGAQIMYGIGKGGIQLALATTDWGLTFDLAEFTDLSEDVGDRYNDRLILPFRVDDLVWLVLAGYAGFAALRGRGRVAGGEVLVSIVVLGLATVLFQNRGDYMDSLAVRIDEVTADLLSVTSEEPPGDEDFCARYDDPTDCVEDAIDPLQTTIYQQFVEAPYFQLNWGTTPTGNCLDAANRILATGYEGDGWPQRYMESEGCEEEADFGAEVGTDRLLGALLTMVVGLLVTVLLGLAAITVLISKFLIAVLFALTPFMTLAAVLPGTGRRAAWAWAGALLQLVVTCGGMVVVIVVMMLSTTEVIAMAERLDYGLTQTWLTLLVVVSVVYFTRTRMLGGIRSLANSASDALTRLSPASANWQGGGQVGFDMGRTDRIAWRTARTGGFAAGATVAAVGSVARQRMAERRSARRSYRTADRMERTRERGYEEARWDTYRYGAVAGSPLANRIAGNPPNPGNAPQPAAPVAPAPAPAPPPAGGQPPGGLIVARQGMAGQRAALAQPPAPAPTPAPTPAPAPVAPPHPGENDGQVRMRYQVRQHQRLPRSLLTHPIGGTMDRLRNNAPIVGNRARYQRMAQRRAQRVEDGYGNGQPQGLGWP